MDHPLTSATMDQDTPAVIDADTQRPFQEEALPHIEHLYRLAVETGVVGRGARHWRSSRE